MSSFPVIFVADNATLKKVDKIRFDVLLLLQNVIENN
jgi:hypothetical protein